MSQFFEENELNNGFGGIKLQGEETRETPEEKGKNRRMKIVLFLVFIAFNVLVIAYTAVHEFSSKPPEKLGFTLGPWNILMIAAGFGCAFAAIFLETAKYVLMMRELNVKVSFRAAFETAALGKYYDNITPSGAGGQPFQIYNLYKAGYSGGASMAMPLTGFFTMQTGFVVLALVSFIFNGDAVDSVGIRIPAYIGVVLYMLVPALIIIFTISEPAGQKLIRTVIGLGAKIRLIKHPDKLIASLIETFDEHRKSVILISRKKWMIPALLALSILFQTAILSIPFFVIRAFNGDVSFVNILTMTVYAYCAITIIPTPGNSGAAEGAFYIIFSQLDPTGLFWSMLIWRLACYYSFIVIGIVIYSVKAGRIGAKRKEVLKEHGRT